MIIMVIGPDRFYLDCMLMRVSWIGWMWPVLLTACTQQEVTRGDQLKFSVLPAQLERLPQENNGAAWGRFGLTGRVKQVDTRWYSARLKDGAVVSSPLRVGSVLYQQESLHFTDTGLLRESHTGDLQQDSITVVHQYTYDTAGRLITYVYSRGGVRIPPIHYGYDSAGRLIACTRQLSGVAHQTQETFNYDSAKRSITGNAYAGERLLASRIYILDEHQRTVAYRYANPPDRDHSNFEIRYAYDDDGHVLTETNFDERGMVTHTIRYTWNNGQCVRSEAFDENNQRIGEEVYTYKTDDHGNWTHKVVWILGKPWVMAERKLVYY